MASKKGNKAKTSTAVSDKTKSVSKPMAVKPVAVQGSKKNRRSKRNNKKKSPQKPFKKLPVTLLSGFLGAGKTTLLEHILKNNNEFKCAVIVNDMASLNIDAELIRSHQVLRTEEKIVQMQNGCICCTLREDLLIEVGKLAKEGKFDYLVIESTGISEPIQVAETFSFEYGESRDGRVTKTQEALKGISDLAVLDTCVSVVDALHFFSTLETADFLVDRYNDTPEDDDRTISDLMIDQIEFADVILINKVDLVTIETLQRVKAVIKKLNPQAKIFETKHAKIDLKEVLNTKLFSFDKAAASAGWLKSLQEELINGGVPKPETAEYGVSSFVYSSRKPFHPKRLWELLKDLFCIIEESYNKDEEGDEEELDVEGEDEDEDEVEECEEDGEEDINAEEEEERKAEIAERVKSKLASPVFGPVLRSKGFFWLATRNKSYGEWSSAGCVLTTKAGGPWYGGVPLEEWPEDAETRASIRSDFREPFQDRRQELVFIGIDIDRKKIEQALNSCLLTNREMKEFRQYFSRYLTNAEEAPPSDLNLEDPWEAWFEGEDDHDLDDAHHE